MEDSQLIDLYIRNELSTSERQSFEDRLSTDDGFKAEYTSTLELQQGIRLSHLQDKLDFLKEVEAEQKQSNKVVQLPSTKRQLFSKIAIAATIILALGISVWLVLDTTADNTETLFATNFQPDDHYFTNRSDSTDNRQECYTHYSNKEWDKASTCIQQLLDTEEKLIDHYYLGIVFLATNQPKEAIHQFDSINVVPELITVDQLFWYKGLAYIHDGQLDRAMNTLESVSGDLYGNAAKKLLNDLKKLKAI